MATGIAFIIVVVIAGISALVRNASGSSSESSDSVEFLTGSLSDRVNAARLMEQCFNEGMGGPHKAELMGFESTTLNLLCPNPIPIAAAYETAPPTLIRKLKLAGFTTIIFSDQSGQSVKIVDLTI
jgi:hypothetical protein